MIGDLHFIQLSIAITALGIFLTGIIPARTKAGLTALIIVVNSLLTSIPAIHTLAGQPFEFNLPGTLLFGDILIRIDGLTAWFILIINLTCINGAIYGIGYMKSYSEQKAKLSLHWMLFILFHASMLWVCMIQNSLAFLIAWEIMSLSSMLLVIFEGKKADVLKAGINYLVQMHISVVFLTVGFIWVYSITGSYSFDSIRTVLGMGNSTWLFLVFFIGFGFKAGFIPLHTWLPHAHPAAPSHISGIMSGVIVKLGIYGIFRMITYLSSDFILLGEIVLLVSVLTGIYGILNAAVHRDFKRMLAYCTIENIGIIGIGIGTGLLGIGNGSALMIFFGFGGALLHVLNHSLFKSLLFFSAGAVYQQTHTRDMNQLGGLIKSMPKTALLFLVGALAIGGLPPFNGFVSEFILYSGLIEGIHSDNLGLIFLFVLSIAGLSIIGGLSILTFTKTFGSIFLGNPRKSLPLAPQEVSVKMLMPQYFILGIMLSIALIPQIYLKVAGTVLAGLNLPGFAEPIAIDKFSSSIGIIALSSLILIVVSGLIWVFRTYFLKTASRVEPTWGCGYTAPNSRMQYTEKSFSKPLSKILNFILIEKKNYKELTEGEIFPAERKYSSHYLDLFENSIIESFTHRLVYGANYFKFIQNGRIQSYVLYGILFILAIFLLTILNIVR